MEETQSPQVVEQPVVAPSQNGPTYAPVAEQKKGGTKWLLIFIILLIVGGAGIFLFSKSGDSIPTPTPSFGEIPFDVTPEPTASPTPSAESKTKLTVEVQNGTGITGEAAYLQNKLKTLGYSNISVGNATKTDYTETSVTFSKNVSQVIKDEMVTELEKIYKSVSAKTSSTQTKDIVVITGPRIGETPKASASATPKASSSPTSSATPTATTQ